MSLFSSLGHGDIWSISGISFASPVNDILDKESYTLEELLQEDDLLQEVKSKNERLLAFLQTEETVETLVEYVVTAADDDAEDFRKFKYPYMACELFCCEVQKVLDILVEGQDGKFLSMLFSLLDNEAPLDHYLAGYFEKILEMLFRRMTIPVMMYLNNGGVPLLQKFLNHIENYSVMQIVQRVMLPHIPFSMEDVEVMSPEEKLNYQCNWSFQKETCHLLCSRMLTGESYDIPSHISDLLITVLQLSPHDSLFLTHLCEPRCLDDLLKFSFQDYTERTSVTDLPSVESSLSLASISVLESLISRLCETMNPFEGGEEKDVMDDAQKTMALIGECVDKVSSALIEYVPKFAAQLKAYTETDVCGTFQSQSQCTYRRLGQRGLQLVKLVEAIVRLANDHIDSALCVSGALKACVDLMFHFDLNSLLHLSVQRIILILIEGGATEGTIHCLLVDCGLLRHIIDIISEESACASSESNEEAAQEKRTKSLIAGSRRPVVGHVVSIAQSIVGAMHVEKLNVDGSIDASQDVSNDNILDESGESHQQPTLVKTVLTSAGMFDEWDAFVQTGLQQLMDRQSAYGNVDNNDVSTDSGKMSQMEAALEALALQDSSWLRQNDDDVQNNVFDDDDSDDDDDDNSDDEDDYHNYGQSNFSSQIKVTAVIKDDDNADRNMVDFEDDEFEIGDQFAKFVNDGSNDQNFADFNTNETPSFAANFDSVPEANFGADFDSPQFDSTPTFEANFETVPMGEDLFADFSNEKGNKTDAFDEIESEKKDPFFSTVSDLKDIDDGGEQTETMNSSADDGKNNEQVDEEKVERVEEGSEEVKGDKDVENVEDKVIVDSDVSDSKE